MVKTLRGSQQGTVGGGDAERVQLVFTTKLRIRGVDCGLSTSR